MKIVTRFCVVIAVLGLFAFPCQAATKDERLVWWSATSTTAMSITGDVALGADRLVIGDEERSYRMTEIRTLDEAETRTAAKLLGEEHLIKAVLYNIDILQSARFRSRNRICGRNPVTKVIVVEGISNNNGDNSLGLIFFEGDKEPFFVGWEHTPSGLCATFLYRKFGPEGKR